VERSSAIGCPVPMIALTLAPFGVATTTNPWPVFSKDFYTGSQDNVAIVQDGYFTEGGGCCSATKSSNCKVQAISMGSDVREQGSLNRTRSDSAQGSVVTDYIAKKQFAVVPAGTPGAPNSTNHKWVCAAFCPTDGDFISSATIGDGKTTGKDRPKDLGKQEVRQPKSIGGQAKTCEHWKWTETIFGVVPMETTDFYVDPSGAKPVPWFSSASITPFGGPAIGQENTSFVGFTPVDWSKDKDGFFDIDPDTVKNCAPNPQGCGDNDKHDADNLMAYSRTLQRLRFAKSITQAAEEKAAALGYRAEPRAAMKADPPPEPKIPWPKDFTAAEDARMVINQGGAQKPNGDLCCAGAPGQCQIQFGHQTGLRYYDSTHDRERFEDHISGQVVVTDYAAHKDMLINVTASGEEFCQEYCPIDPRDKMGAFDPFDPFDPVVDRGEATYKGKKLHHYEWKDKILKFITMQTSELYVDDSDATSPKPVALNSVLSPFGITMGVQNNTWASWTPGTPAAAKFAIQGVATCKMSSQCQQGSKQAHRARRGDLFTFYRYMLADADQKKLQQ
jgi:hypothetical protein